MHYKRITVLFTLPVVMIFFGLLMQSCARKDASPSNRYVVLSPEIAEILCAIGAEADIVGVTDECIYPASLTAKTSVGKFGALNREKIIALKPTLIFSSSLEQQAVAEEFAKLGFRVESFYPRSLDHMLSGIRDIGKLTHHTREASDLADDLAVFIRDTRDKAKGSPRPKVYLEIYRDPLMSVSDQSFVGELIELAGGDNIFPTLERDYSRIDPEDVISAAPDIIICYSQDTLAGITNRKGWQDIPAVRDKRIYFDKDIDPDWIQRAGPRIVNGTGRLIEIYQDWAEDQRK